MVKIEADSLEEAYASAATRLECSVTELQVEIVQYPSKGMLGFFKKRALIVASCKSVPVAKSAAPAEALKAPKEEERPERAGAAEKTVESAGTLDDTILPESFVTGQEEEAPQPRSDVARDSDAVSENFFDERPSPEVVAQEVHRDINALFEQSCFKINAVEVSVYDENTLLVEFTGEDAALLIGKEGYRYKALSYMIFNWINAKYQMQLRLEIAEFLKNQEESIARYLVSVCENVDRDGRAQTKILDGVLVQIALKQLRGKYPGKYVAIRSTRDGQKFIIVNNYNDY